MAVSDQRALAIRDHVLPLIRARGQLEDGTIKTVRLRVEPCWMFSHWTPFSALAPEEASSPGYRHALERQRTRLDMPYGLDIWRDGANALSVLWADDGASDVMKFKRGEWEDEALKL